MIGAKNSKNNCSKPPAIINLNSFLQDYHIEKKCIHAAFVWVSIQNEVEAEEDVAPTVPAPWLHLGNLGVPDCHRYVPNKRMAHKDIMDITKFTLYTGVYQ